MDDAIDLPDAMPAIGRLAQVETVEMRQRDDRLCLSVAILDRRQLDCLGLKARAPEQGLAI
jgi:hypothetical protein